MKQRVSAGAKRMSPDPRRLHREQHVGKMVHANEDEARKYANGHARVELDATAAWMPYPCQWTDDWADLRTGPVHWHVGRAGRESSKFPAAPDYMRA